MRLAWLIPEMQYCTPSLFTKPSIYLSSECPWTFVSATNANIHQLGTFTRGKRKVEDMQGVIAEARRVQGH